MKTLSKFLKWFTVLFLLRILYLVILQIQNFYFLFIDKLEKLNMILNVSYPENINKNVLLFISIIMLGLLLYLIYNLFIFIKVSNSLNRNSVFKERNAAQLFIIGKSLIIFNSILILIKIPLKFMFLLNDNSMNQGNSYYFGYSLGYIIPKNLYLFITGIFILIIAHLIRSGSFIKQENDLTI